MAAKKLFFKIGEACKQLDIQPYVLRYWETEFSALKPDKSKSGQRVYSEDDLQIIRRIKELLYDEGYTIAGAKKKLESELSSGGPKSRRRADEKKAQAEEPDDHPDAEAAEEDASDDGEAEASDETPEADETEPEAPEPATAETVDLSQARAGVEKALEQARDLLDRLERSA